MPRMFSGSVELSLLEPADSWPGQPGHETTCISWQQPLPRRKEGMVYVVVHCVDVVTGAACGDLLPLNGPGHLGFFIQLFLHWLICWFFCSFIYSILLNQRNRSYGPRGFILGMRLGISFPSTFLFPNPMNNSDFIVS